MISPAVLAAYAGDAARGVEGVHGLSESGLHRRPVKVIESGGSVAVELHLSVEWGVDVPSLGATVQRTVAEYLERMADVKPAAVDVIVVEVEPPPPAGDA